MERINFHGYGMKFNVLALIILLSGIIPVIITIHAWQHRLTNGARQFTWFMAALTIYNLGYGMELASLDLSTMLFWNKVQYLGILSFPSLFVFFTLQYSGYENRLTWKNISLALFLPLVMFIIKIFDDSLHLIYVTSSVDASGSIPLLVFTRGPLYWVFVVYNVFMVSIGNYLLWRKRSRSSALYRGQTNIMLAAVTILYLEYFFYLTGINPFPQLKNLDLNVFSYIIWGLAISLAIFRYRLFDLAPIARDTLIEILNDGVIVLDEQHRLTDANPQAQKIFEWQETPLGQSADQFMDTWFDLRILSTVETPIHIETCLSRKDNFEFYEVTISRLKDKHGFKIGFLIVMHDISKRKEFEHKLKEVSLTDELTGLLNRRGFKMLADQLINMANRMNLNAILFYIDLDRLKWINDTLGHASGDLALQDSASILLNTFRSSDIIARFGGDEFVILAIEVAEHPQKAMLNRLQEKIRLYNENCQRDFKLSFSIGMAYYDCKKPLALDELLEKADQSMYIEKQAKRNLQSAG
mgnify:CR=1 FL=1